MSKIVRAVNAMVVNEDKISNVLTFGGDFAFLYKNKYVWSIGKTSNEDYVLRYFPGESSTLELEDWDAVLYFSRNSTVSYLTSEIDTKEAIDSFADLFNIVKGKVFGMDLVLDDILVDEYNPYAD